MRLYTSKALKFQKVNGDGLIQNKYQTETTRLQGWDYSSEGHYFITICTKNRACWFGQIVNARMELSPIGEIVKEQWQKTQALRMGVKLDEWIIMPNHFHAIVALDYRDDVETHGHASLQKSNLSNIVRGFKASTTKVIHENCFPDFEWQARFYDHIIRNEKALNQIREYVHTNPERWEMDEENPQNAKR